MRAESVKVIDGALPAEYGLVTGAIVDIQTKTDSKIAEPPSGRLTISTPHFPTGEFHSQHIVNI